MLLLMKIYQTSFKNFTENDLDRHVFIRFCVKTPFKGSVIYRRLYIVISHNKSGWLTSFHTTYIDSSQEALSNYIYIMDTKLMYCVKDKKPYCLSSTVTYLTTGNKSICYVLVMLIRRRKLMRATVT